MKQNTGRMERGTFNGRDGNLLIPPGNLTVELTCSKIQKEQMLLINIDTFFFVVCLLGNLLGP